MKNYFTYFNAVFGITQQLINNTRQVIKMRETPLFLGVKVKDFVKNNKEKLSSIVFVGGLIKRKRVEEFFRLAEHFSNLQFHIIGEGPEGEKLRQTASKNVVFHGVLNHKEMDVIFSSSDLLFLPSKSEGFPKVILEAASTGIPSVVYDSYGASEWMDNKKNGFVVSAFKQVEELIHELLENPTLLQQVSKNTQELAHRFDWKHIINDWEKVIVNLYKCN